MNIENKTILITGGGSGIGFETAKLLSQKGNKIVIIGRNYDKLKMVADSLQNVTPISCDVNKENEVKNLVQAIQTNFPELSILINNAGKAFKYEHGSSANAYEKARQEMETNYLSVIRLTELLLPILQKQTEAAIINVSSITALSPVSVIPTYSDSKAALHSYTLSLRKTLAEKSSIKVFELLPPTVNTEFSKEIGGETKGIPSREVAEALLDGLKNDQFEIGVGLTIPFAENFFQKRSQAFEAINQR
ncbi:SDR family oxidoreductase [Sphingobacterium multivorum]|uniref:SDR family oxidoreductase n=1 Tax=Sphingobacterium multivorum TaxID=28454 RepID=UPI00345EECCF